MIRRLGVVTAVVGLLAGCASAVDGQGSAVKPTSSSSTSSAPVLPSGPRYPRLTSQNEFGDPPVDDVCKTLGTAMFHGTGYVASVPSGTRAAACSYYLNFSSTSTIVKPQLYVDVFLDSEDFGGQADKTIGSYGLRVTKPAHSGDPCIDDVLTAQLDVDIQVSPARQTPSTSTLCDLASDVAHRVVTVMDDHAIVTRTLAKDSITNQDLCAALDATAERVKLPSGEAQLGFQTACHIATDDFDYWIELRFGIQPSNAESGPATVDGHRFATDLVPSSGYCRYRWQGPQIPGTSQFEEITVKRIADDPKKGNQSCFAVGELAGELITSLGRH